MALEVQTNFTAEDMLGSNRDKPDTKSQAQEASEPATATNESPGSNESTGPQESGEEDQEDDEDESPPQGTSREILAWVDEKASRAKAALDAERESFNPRKSLIAPLEKIIKKAK